MPSQNTCAATTTATPNRLPLTDAVVSILNSPDTPTTIYNALADSLDDAWREAGVCPTKNTDLLRFKLDLLFGNRPAPPTETPSPTTNDQTETARAEREDIARILDDVFARIDRLSPVMVDSYDDRLEEAGYYAVGVARGVFRGELAGFLGSYDLLRQSYAVVTQGKPSPEQVGTKIEEIHRERERIARTLGELFQSIDEWDAKGLGGVAEQLADVGLYAVGLAQGVFEDELENSVTYYDLLRDAYTKATQGQPNETPAAANQGPGLADLHRRCFELHLRRMVRAFETMEGNFDEVYKSIVDPENHTASPSLEDLVLDFRDMKRTIRQFSVLFGIDPRTVYDEADDMESESF